VVDRNVMPVTAGGMVNARAPRAYRTRGWFSTCRWSGPRPDADRAL